MKSNKTVWFLFLGGSLLLSSNTKLVLPFLGLYLSCYANSMFSAFNKRI
jgi:hypothetical protein